MAEIPDRVPGGVILASYANQIRDRTAQRYADPTARDASTPLPAEGELAFIDSLDVLQVFAGGLWRSLLDDVDQAALSARLDVFEDRAMSEFNPNEVTLVFNGSEMAAVSIPSPGDYLARVQALVELKPDNNGQNHAADMFIRVDDVKREEWAIYVRPDTSVTDVDIDIRINFYAEYPLLGMNAGQVVDLWAELNTTVDGTARAFNRSVSVERWPAGTLAGITV